MKPEGTPFQQKVWAELRKIPRGEVRTYAQVAAAIGHPRAYRAVANACARNPHPISTPCHRVIASDGSLGGYSYGGPTKKRALLKAEGVIVPSKTPA